MMRYTNLLTLIFMLISLTAAPAVLADEASTDGVKVDKVPAGLAGLDVEGEPEAGDAAETNRPEGAGTATDDAEPPKPNQILIDAGDAIIAGKVTPFRNELEKQIKKLLEPVLDDDDETKPDTKQLVYVAAAERAIRRFDKPVTALDSQQKETLAWLVRQPKLGPQFMLALRQGDRPYEALDIVADIRGLSEKTAKRMDDQHELVTALAVVYDTPPSAGQIDPKLSRPLFMYRWYTEKRFQYDPVKMPWRLSVFTVDGIVSAEEMVWAYKQYSSTRSVGASFFDVPYDYDAFYDGKEKQISKHDYTLRNLTLFGGVCADQAYFASQVGKAIGVPSTYTSGQGGAGGVGHAWVGYVAIQGSRALWDFSEGRYDEHKYWSGAVADPQTRGGMTDADVSVTAMLIKTPPSDRLLSQAGGYLAAYAGTADRIELLVRSIELSPANTIAWELLIKEAERGDVPEAQLVRIDSALQKFAAGAFPDFAYHKMHAMVRSRPSEEQLKLYEAMIRTFRHRPDLVAKTRIAQGDLLKSQGEKRKALAAYMDVVRLARDAGPEVPGAVKHAAELLDSDAKKTELYRTTWKSLPQPSTTPYATATPFYQIGRTYAELLRRVGNEAEANNVDRRLDSLIRKGDA